VHDHAAVGFLVVADADHVDGAIESEHAAGESQSAAPLTGAGFGGEAADALALVVVSLGDGGVGLMAAGRADALVLVVDVGGGLEGVFEAAGAIEGSGPPEAVNVEDLARDVNFGLRGEFLLDEGAREDGLEFGGSEGLKCSGVDGRRHGLLKVRQDVDPGGRDLIFGQEELGEIGHSEDSFERIKASL